MMEDNSQPPESSRFILLHQCCAPCSAYPLERLKQKGEKVFGYFFNPNIHPYTEFKRRLECVQTHNNRVNIPYYIDEGYGLRGFLKAVSVEQQENLRCLVCYKLRLDAAAEFAKENGFSAMTTTLLYSRRQNHEAVASIGVASAKSFGVDFYYEDFRTGWQAGIALSKELGMYRQSYCGCIFSEEERYCPKR
jgi:predicted adenine nucleotide alpha hydrolase (AANH) superfamily ATPase